jgi:thymidylate synthase
LRRFPRFKLNPDVKEIDGLTYEDVKILGYKAHLHIAGKVAVYLKSKNSSKSGIGAS